MKQFIKNAMSCFQKNKKIKVEWNKTNILLESGITLIPTKTILKDDDGHYWLYFGSYELYNTQFFSCIGIINVLGHSDFLKNEIEKLEFYKIKEEEDVIAYLQEGD